MMRSSTGLKSALQASVFGLLVSTVFAQTPTAELGPITTLGCYSDPGSLVKDNTDLFQASGLCQTACGQKGHSVMATVGGSTCYCGDILPALDKVVDTGKCNQPCLGFGTQMCGGIGYYQLYLTGLTGDVQTAPNSTSSSSSSGSHTSASHTAETVVVTQSATSSPTGETSSGPNKIGIAVGVVVGVILVCGLVGGFMFYLKQKRRREIEEEHKAQAAVNSFIGSRGTELKPDARLDPSVASSYRRESIGSIADERDFSRRILQVRNPDRGSINSVA